MLVRILLEVIDSNCCLRKNIFEFLMMDEWFGMTCMSLKQIINYNQQEQKHEDLVMLNDVDMAITKLRWLLIKIIISNQRM